MREVLENTDRMQGTSVIEATSTRKWSSRPQQRYHPSDLLDETCNDCVPLCSGFGFQVVSRLSTFSVVVLNDHGAHEPMTLCGGLR